MSRTKEELTAKATRWPDGVLINPDAKPLPGTSIYPARYGAPTATAFTDSTGYKSQLQTEGIEEMEYQLLRQSLQGLDEP